MVFHLKQSIALILINKGGYWREHHYLISEMGFKTEGIPYRIKVGNDVTWTHNLRQTVSDYDQEFDFIVVDIANPLNFRDRATAATR